MTQKKQFTYYVYILRCADKSYYVGVTNDLRKRLSEHQFGLDKNSYTYKRKPVELMFQSKFNDIRHAINFEKQVKGWSRKKKEALIGNDWYKIHRLAECKNRTKYKKDGHPSTSLGVT